MAKVNNVKTVRARGLRRGETQAEAHLWQALRANRLEAEVEAPSPFAPYILDFFCIEAGLVVEVDGGQHAEERADYDARRTAYLESRELRCYGSGIPRC